MSADDWPAVAAIYAEGIAALIDEVAAGRRPESELPDDEDDVPPESATVAEVTCAIDAARAAEPGGAIAFDGDGTLWAGDIGEDFFVALLRAGLSESVREPLAREAAEAGLDATGTAVEIAARIPARPAAYCRSTSCSRAASQGRCSRSR